MEQQQQGQPPQGGVPGPTGRRLHIAHRRSPSELTPLMSMFTSPGSELPSALLCSSHASKFRGVYVSRQGIRQPTASLNKKQ